MRVHCLGEIVRFVGLPVLAFVALFLPGSVIASTLYDNAFEARLNDPTNRTALNNFSTEATKVGQYDQALSTLEQIIFETPDDIEPRVAIARLYYHVGSFDLALSHANEALALAAGTDFEQEIIELQRLIEKAQNGVRAYLDVTLGVDYSWIDEDRLVLGLARPLVRAEGAGGFAALDGVVELDLETASRDLLIFSSGLVYAGALGDVDFNTVYSQFEAGSGYAAATYSKGLPDLIDTLRVDISAYAQLSDEGADRFRREYGVRTRANLRPTVESAFYLDVGYAWLGESSNLFADDSFFYGAGVEYRFAPGWTLGLDLRRRHTRGFVPAMGGTGTSLDYDVAVTTVSASVTHLLHVFADGRSWFQQLSGSYDNGDVLDYGTVSRSNPLTADLERWRIDWDHTVQTSTNGKVSFGVGYQSTLINRGTPERVDRGDWTVRAQYTHRFQ